MPCIGTDLLQGIQNILKCRTLILRDHTVFGDSDQGRTKRVDIFQGSQYFQRQSVKVYNVNL